MGKAIRPDHVAIYIRWSTDDQAQGTTLEVQREGCEHYLRSQGWHVRDDLVFVDDGFSGSNLDRRGMMKLRELVAGGEIDCVVVMKIDRLSRNIVDAVELVLREWDDRCHVKSVREPIDTTTDLGRMIFGLLAMFADFERGQIRDRTLSGKVRRIAEGKQMHGRPAFGYQPHPTDRGVWVENPLEAPLIRMIFQMATAGVSANQIGRRLNDAGYRTRSGKSWSIRAVLTILHNRVYIGEIHFGRTSLKPGATNRRVRTVNAEPLFRGATKAAPHLISQDEFSAAQERIKRNRVVRKHAGSRALSSPHLLVGLAQCPCGGALIHKVGAQRGPDQKPVRHYICHRSRHGECSHNGHIPAAVVERVIESAFLQRFDLSQLSTAEVDETLREVHEEKKALSASLAAAQSELDRLSKGDHRVMMALQDGQASLDEVRWMRKELQQRRDELHARVLGHRGRHELLSASVAQIHTALQQENDAMRWSLLSAEEKRQLIGMGLQDRIRVHRSKGTTKITLEVHWVAPIVPACAE